MQVGDRVRGDEAQAVRPGRPRLCGRQDPVPPHRRRRDVRVGSRGLGPAAAGGGCAGFQYGFSFDEDKDESDTMVAKNGVKLVVDPMSIQYLLGAEIDFQEDLQGARFVIKNPNASTTCSCGSSFS